MNDNMKNDTEKFNKESITQCQSVDEIYQRICSHMFPLPGKEELSEEDLESVTGGMSSMQALEVIAAAYYDLCVKKKEKTSYTNTQIYEALNVCHRINRQNQNNFDEIGKVTSLLIGALNERNH